ncbi:hypothetical protein ACTMTI_18475 [Nonomuraea sp. H19]|uniref:hypothetical protein n=1 Tax=Nonomuraea sp. H19 TaxID=3452206 RepID=UPI003F8A6BEB
MRHREYHQEFITQQRLDRALRAVGDLSVQLVGQARQSIAYVHALCAALRGLQRPADTKDHYTVAQADQNAAIDRIAVGPEHA